MNMFKPQKNYDLWSPQTPLPHQFSTALKEAIYTQQGDDLVIKLHGHTWVIHNYFLNPVELQLQTGQKLSVQEIMNWSHTSSILTNNGEIMNVQIKQSIGTVVSIIKGPMTAQGEQGQPRSLSQGDPVYLHDTITTTAQSYIKIKFNDGTFLQLGPLSRAQLDQYTYEPNGAEGKFQASIFSGIFHYISGKLSGHHHGEHSKIITPSANIGIRGSEIEAQIGSDGSTTILHLDGVISVTSRYIAQTEEVIYERGATIYVPAEALSPLVSQITEEKIEQYQHQNWQSLAPTTTASMSEEFNPNMLTQPSHISSSEEIIHFRPHPSEGRLPPLPGQIERHEERPDRLIPREEMSGEFPERNHRDFPGKEGEHFPERNFLDRPLEEGRFPGKEQFPPREPPPEDFENPGAAKHDNPDQPTVGGTLKPSPGFPVTPPEKPEKENFVQEIQVEEDNPREDISDPRGKIVNVNEDPLHGQVTINVDDEAGTLTYTPNENFYGTDQVTYVLEDGRSGTLYIIVEPVNDLPLIKEGNLDIEEDTSSYVFLADDLLRDHVIDVDGDQLNIVRVLPIMGALKMNPDLEVVQLPHGTVRLLNEQGDISYSPQANFNGQEEFAYLVQDSQGGTSVGKIVVTVQSVNDPPEAHDDSIFLNNLLPVVLSTDQLIKNDFDVEGDPLQIIEVINPIGGQVDFKSGVITFTPSTHFTQGRFDYVLSDGEKTDNGQVSIGKMDTPLVFLQALANDDKLVIPRGGISPIHISPAQLLGNDLGNLEIIQVKEAYHGQVDSDNQGNILFTPDAQFMQSGTGRFIYQVADGEGHTDFALVVLQLNTPPQAYEDFFTLHDSNPLVLTPLTLLSNDQDAEGDPLFIASVTNGVHGTATLDSQGNIVFTPHQEEFSQNGFGTFSYQASDGNQVGNQVSVTVNAPPSPPPPPTSDDGANNINRLPIAGKHELVINNYQAPSFKISFDELLKEDSDPDHDPLNITQVNQRLNGQVALVPTEGNIEFIPTANFIQQEKGQFTYEISDGRGGTTLATVDLVIHPIVAIPDFIETHDLITFPIENILNNDSFGVQFSQGYNATHGNIHVQGGKIEFTPEEIFFAEKEGNFTYEVKDQYGNTAHAQVTFLLKNVPPVAHDGKIELDNRTLLTIEDLREPLGIFDPDGDIPQITHLTLLNGADEVVLQEGKISFMQPPHDLRETNELLIDINDGHGATTQAIVTVYRNIPSSNIPSATDDEVTTTKNQPILISVLANDVDANIGDKSELNGFSQPLSGGTVTQQREQLLFEPTNHFTGTATWTYTVKNQHGAVSQEATIKVTVINRPPEAQDDPSQESDPQKFTTFQETPLTISTQELLKNDTDLDPNDSPKIIDAKVLQGTESVLLTGDHIEFKPTPGFTGEASFSYTIADQSDAQNDATVIINVIPHLIAVDDTLPSVSRNTEVLISGKEKLLSNDLSISHDGLTILQVDQPNNGTVELLDVQGNIKFTPTPDFSGQASFEYTVQDSLGQTDQATVSIEVIPNKDPAIILPTIPLIYLGEPLHIASGATVTDLDSLNFDQGKLQVTVTNRSSSDFLEIQSMETQEGTLNISSPTGGTIIFNGALIGDFSSDVSTGGLGVNLNDKADQTSTSALLQAITYHTTSPFDEPRTIELMLIDGDGGISPLVTREISMGNPNAIAVQDFLSRDFNLSTAISMTELLRNDRPLNAEDVLRITEVNSPYDEVKVELVGSEVKLFIDGLVHDNFDQITFNYTVNSHYGGQDVGEVIVTPSNVTRGDSGDNPFQGTAHMDICLGEGGNDTFTSSEGMDILLGGEGEDIFLLNPLVVGEVTFKGGEGQDVLKFEGITNTLIELVKPEVGKFDVQEIEVIDLSGRENHLSLSLQEVLDISDQNRLTIEGDGSNIFNSQGQGWSPQGLQGSYYLYTAGSSGVELLVNKDIVQLVS